MAFTSRLEIARLSHHRLHSLRIRHVQVRSGLPWLNACARPTVPGCHNLLIEHDWTPRWCSFPPDCWLISDVLARNDGRFTRMILMNSHRSSKRIAVASVYLSLSRQSSCPQHSQGENHRTSLFAGVPSTGCREDFLISSGEAAGFMESARVFHTVCNIVR